MKKQIIKVSLETILGKLSRKEMKEIMAGSGFGNTAECCVVCPGDVTKCRDCLIGNPCATEGTTIACGTGPYTEVCPISFP